MAAERRRPRDATAAPQPPGTHSFVTGPRMLGGMVASAVGYQSEGAVPQLHRGLPSPYLTLVFSLDEPIVTGDSPEHLLGPDAYRTSIVLGGLHHRPAYVEQPSRQSGVQLAVHPLAARALLGVRTSELTQLAAEGGDVLGPGARRIRQQLCEQENWQDRFATLAGYLRARAEDAGASARVRPEVAEAWRWIAWHRGTGSLDGMAAHVSMSRRQLTTLFRREVGATPKQVSRLMRFERARAEVSAAVTYGDPPDLSAVAARCGYYDHPHLVRDFRQYTGLSPSGWIAEEHRNFQAGAHPVGEN